MPWIENTSRSSIVQGFHRNPHNNTMLIQIADPPGDFPTPEHFFAEVHQFQFLDVEENDEVLDEEMRCSQEQANELVRLLRHALANDMNVVVHCHAGACRSGAVADVGIRMGFEDAGKFRFPNNLVLTRMLNALAG